MTCSPFASTAWTPKLSAWPASPILLCRWKRPDGWARFRGAPSSSRTPRPEWRRGATAGSHASSVSTAPGIRELLRCGADVVVCDLADLAVRKGDKRMSQLPNAWTPTVS